MNRAFRVPLLSLIVMGWCHSVYGIVDLVLFSFDRPLQLYALLESIEKYTSHAGDIRVIYRASNDAALQAYKEVKQNFPLATFHEQGNNPHSDFKPLTMAATFETPHEYVVFAVDDIVLTDYIDFAVCVEALKKNTGLWFLFAPGYKYYPMLYAL